MKTKLARIFGNYHMHPSFQDVQGPTTKEKAKATAETWLRKQAQAMLKDLGGK